MGCCDGDVLCVEGGDQVSVRGVGEEWQRGETGESNLVLVVEGGFHAGFAEERPLEGGLQVRERHCAGLFYGGWSGWTGTGGMVEVA